MRQLKVIATAAYERRVRKLLPPMDRTEMEEAIAANPEAHPLIPGTKGVRKARWSRPGLGKGGGVRLILLFLDGIERRGNDHDLRQK